MCGPDGRFEAELEGLEHRRVDGADGAAVEIAVAYDGREVGDGEGGARHEERRDEHFCLGVAFGSNDGALEGGKERQEDGDGPSTLEDIYPDGTTDRNV